MSLYLTLKEVAEVPATMIAAVYPWTVPVYYFIQGIVPFDFHFSCGKELPSDHKMQRIVEKMKMKIGISKDVYVKMDETQEIGFAHAYGNNLLPGCCGITLRLNERSSIAAPAFTIAHELYHIKHNDFLIEPLVAGLAIIITHIVLHILFPAVASCTLGIIPLVVGFATYFWFLRKRVELADREAFKVCTKRENLQVIKLFEKFRRFTKLERMKKNTNVFRKFFANTFIMKDGEFIWGSMHPPITERIRYLKEALRKR